MDRFVNALVLWDDNNQFVNSIVSINAASVVVGTVNKPDAIYPPASTDVTLVPTLQIKDPNHGTLFLNLTLADYQQLVRLANDSPNKTVPLTYTVPTDIPTGVYISTPEMVNSTVTGLAKNGTTLNFGGGRDYVVLNATTSIPTIKLTAALVDTDVVTIYVYYN